MRKRTIVKMSAAVYHFVNYSRDIEEIAEAVSISTDALRQWARTEEWNFALSVFNYEGDTGWLIRRRDVKRNPMFSRAKGIFLMLKKNGVPKHKLMKRTANAVGVDERNVRYWAKKDNWDSTPTL